VIRLLLLLAVIAVAVDAIVYDGANTKAAWAWVTDQIDEAAAP
jgi:hypothetical protein